MCISDDLKIFVFTYLYCKYITKLFKIAQQSIMMMTYIILPKVTHMMKYEVTECRRGDFHCGSDYHLLWLRIVVSILLTFLRETKSRDIFSSVYGYRTFVNPVAVFKYFVTKMFINHPGQWYLIRNQKDGGI